jgi:hypothetical protein
MIDGRASTIRRIEREIDTGLELAPKEKIISSNWKVGASINFPNITCQPTRICGQCCYGAIPGRPITFTNSIKKFLRNYWYFKNNPTAEVTDRLCSELEKKRFAFLRWNGKGDVFPESARVINEVARAFPKMKFWITTRKPAIVPLIEELPNIFLMFSLDSSSLDRMKKIEDHSRIYYSFLRTKEDDIVPDKAKIVFNLKQDKTLSIGDSRWCRADTKVLTTKNACGSCRKCFSERIFNGR